MVALADRSNLNMKELSDLLGENISVMKAEKIPDTVKKIFKAEPTMMNLISWFQNMKQYQPERRLSHGFFL